jgi:hypothetical protein
MKSGSLNLIIPNENNVCIQSNINMFFFVFFYKDKNNNVRV